MAKFFGFIIGFTGSMWAAVALWSAYIVPLVPAGPYHGLILLGVGVMCFVFLGGLVIWIGALVGMLFALLAGLLTGK